MAPRTPHAGAGSAPSTGPRRRRRRSCLAAGRVVPARTANSPPRCSPTGAARSPRSCSGSGQQFSPRHGPRRSRAPPTAAALNKVKSLGQDSSTTRTADQTAAAKFWASAAVCEHLKATRSRRTWQSGGTPPGTDRAPYRQPRPRPGQHDATVGLSNASYRPVWRPVTAIQLGDTTGNPGITGDANWTRLRSSRRTRPTRCPALSAEATATVLAAFYGDRQPLVITLGGTTRTFGSFQAAADKAGSARRLRAAAPPGSDHQAGQQLGAQVAEFVLDHLETPCEPGSSSASPTGGQPRRDCPPARELLMSGWAAKPGRPGTDLPPGAGPPSPLTSLHYISRQAATGPEGGIAMRTYRPGPRGAEPPSRGGEWSAATGRHRRRPRPAGPDAGRPTGPTADLTPSSWREVRLRSGPRVTISPAGQVPGTLATGQPFTTTIPVALDTAARRAPGRATMSRSARLPLPSSSLVPVRSGSFCWCCSAACSSRRSATNTSGLRRRAG